ncbi:MAG: dienelactone hydrolase family protein [Candidatus Eremiobacteraeota bacterium]|nr:dienelactone hydrolase family protein [Candidatus Eremiobacteraeota bacterium]
MSGAATTVRARDGGAIPAYLARPAGSGSVPGIVLLPPIYGIEPVIETIADRWAARGFAVLALNQFWRDPEPEVMARTDEGRARAAARGRRVDVDQLMDDVGDAVASLRGLDGADGRVFVAGFCFGGRYAFLSAARLDVVAAAGFHPTQIGVSLDDAPRIHVPLSLHFGADDPLTPPDEVSAIAAALRARSDAEIVVHDGAAHNFAVPGVAGYVPAVAEASETRAFALFERVAAPR